MFPGRFPHEVIAARDRLPEGLFDEVIEARVYRQAKAMTDAATTAEARKALPDTPIFRRVSEIDMELAAEALAKRRGGGQ